MSICDTDNESILASSDPGLFMNLILSAERVRLAHLGDEVYMRGLIEFSNICRCDCYYCGLRRSNGAVKRYHLGMAQILDKCKEAKQRGIHSIALQSGEIGTDKEVDFIAGLVSTIREFSMGDGSPGLGITLSTGELSYAQYKKLYEAGAHRYLLRIETSDRELFRSIHPDEQLFDRRLECLDMLKDIGYQVGTGIMIGLPGQSYHHLAMDLEFFAQRNIDMLGMGPYIPHPQTPLSRSAKPALSNSYTTTLKMLALARLKMPEINMVVSTALQTLTREGLIMGVRAGGNVIMPIITPEEYREDYALYVDKHYKTLEQLEREIELAGYRLAYNKWGDPRHYYTRQGLPYPEAATEPVGFGEAWSVDT
ncbi:MAG: [FeFe] hydrogenase H-cluster radical SAM maturase HydE [Syntrophomonadaceae bacterium]